MIYFKSAILKEYMKEFYYYHFCNKRNEKFQQDFFKNEYPHFYLFTIHSIRKNEVVFAQFKDLFCQEHFSASFCLCLFKRQHATICFCVLLLLHPRIVTWLLFWWVIMYAIRKSLLYIPWIYFDGEVSLIKRRCLILYKISNPFHFRAICMSELESIK